MKRYLVMAITIFIGLTAIVVDEMKTANVQPDEQKNSNTRQSASKEKIKSKKEISGLFNGLCYRVVDGDSLYLKGHDKQIRLWGVDAPERDEAGYQQAKDGLIQLVKNKQLRCVQQDRDKYGRTVARCFVQSENTHSGDLEINAALLKSGVSDEYCRFTRNYYGYCN